MWARKREEVVEFLLVLLQVGQTGADDQPAHRVSNEADLAEAEVWAVLSDIIIDLLRKSNSHLHDVSLGVLLVGAGAEEHGFGE